MRKIIIGNNNRGIDLWKLREILYKNTKPTRKEQIQIIKEFMTTDEEKVKIIKGLKPSEEERIKIINILNDIPNDFNEKLFIKNIKEYVRLI